MTAKIDAFLASEKPETPCLVIDVDEVAHNYAQFTTHAPWAEVFYAVKANPAAPILKRLNELGASFDAASPAEIRACMEQGVPAARISYGNTVKKTADVAWAHEQGVELFAFDSSAEISKLAEAAPGAKVFCRLVVANDGARWPLSRKFGCAPDEAEQMLLKARDAGLVPYGLSFHVGSQQIEADRWREGISWCGTLFGRLAEEGVALEMVNLGGGFPVMYRDDAGLELSNVFGPIDRALSDFFPDNRPRVMAEPGRALVATAGKLCTEVVLATERSYGGWQRWVYLDVGRYGGLAETEGEAILYPLELPEGSGETSAAVLAGPTCDSHDVLYEHATYEIPVAIQPGDRLVFGNAGAYTTTYASIGFNGFAPLREHFV